MSATLAPIPIPATPIHAAPHAAAVAAGAKQVNSSLNQLASLFKSRSTFFSKHNEAKGDDKDGVITSVELVSSPDNSPPASPDLNKAGDSRQTFPEIANRQSGSSGRVCTTSGKRIEPSVSTHQPRTAVLDGGPNFPGLSIGRHRSLA